MNKRLDNIVSILEKHKGENVEVFDLKDTDYMTEYVVVASSLGERHTEALLTHLKKDLNGSEEFLHVDATGEWIAIDLGDILVHIMIPTQREKYDLDKFLNEVKSK
ncbi:MAG: ribosome silencing factor [Campylobacterota bacterium]|nr:ribosome silencing factor [Campylobacterota bacterium]